MFVLIGVILIVIGTTFILDWRGRIETISEPVNIYIPKYKLYLPGNYTWNTTRVLASSGGHVELKGEPISLTLNLPRKSNCSQMERWVYYMLEGIVDNESLPVHIVLRAELSNDSSITLADYYINTTTVHKTGNSMESNVNMTGTNGETQGYLTASGLLTPQKIAGTMKWTGNEGTAGIVLFPISIKIPRNTSNVTLKIETRLHGKVSIEFRATEICKTPFHAQQPFLAPMGSQVESFHVPITTSVDTGELKMGIIFLFTGNTFILIGIYYGLREKCNAMSASIQKD